MNPLVIVRTRRGRGVVGMASAMFTALPATAAVIPAIVGGFVLAHHPRRDAAPIESAAPWSRRQFGMLPARYRGMPRGCPHARLPSFAGVWLSAVFEGTVQWRLSQGRIVDSNAVIKAARAWIRNFPERLARRGRGGHQPSHAAS